MTPFLLSYSQVAKAARPACTRFRVHLAKELPPIEMGDDSFQTRALPTDLEKAIQLWKNKIYFLQNEKQRNNWLKCIRQFIFLDTNKNGVPDWTALVDGRPGRTIFPLDPDIDGDGIINILDPDPYGNLDINTNKLIPDHLKVGASMQYWQERLWRDQGILAINHTDEHLPDALGIIYATLQLKSIRNWQHATRGLNVIYAFGERNSALAVAAYHPTAHAISIPGKIGFESKNLSPLHKCKFVSSVLHELGHALLFGTVTSSELRDNAIRLGGWDLPERMERGVLSPILFDSTHHENTKFVSDYAGTNVHEWFAESFAAYMWEKESLGSKYCHIFKGKHIATRLKDWFDLLLLRAQFTDQGWDKLTRLPLLFSHNIRTWYKIGPAQIEPWGVDLKASALR